MCFAHLQGRCPHSTGCKFDHNPKRKRCNRCGCQDRSRLYRHDGQPMRPWFNKLEKTQDQARFVVADSDSDGTTSEYEASNNYDQQPAGEDAFAAAEAIDL